MGKKEPVNKISFCCPDGECVNNKGDCKCQKLNGKEGDGTTKGTCTDAGDVCLDDGTCKCQVDENGGGPGNGKTKGTCTDAGDVCLEDGTCKCQVNTNGGG